MVLRCNLCNVEVPDERVLQEHQKGKRHQALVNAREKFEKSQNSSIYISRIQPQHDEEIFRTYFSQFGSIKNCFIDKEKHIYAIIEFDQFESATKCLEQGVDHLLNDGTRLKVKQRNHHDFKSKRMLITEQEFLNINKEKEIEQHAELLQLLNNQPTIDEQAQAIVEHEKIIDVTLKMRKEFFNELQMMFNKYFPEAKLTLTGSMATGLATNLSDMDLVLVLNDTYIEPQTTNISTSSGESMHVDENSCSNDVDMNRQKLKRNLSDESSNQSLSPPLPPVSCSAEDLLQMSIADRLDYIRRLLRSYAAHVCYVQRIAQARCPVLRFCHKQQKVFCELSINNHLAVANTKLVEYFLLIEPKLRPLLYTIRLWMKQKDLLGRGHRFNTYTLFWMVVIAMQLHHTRLPSVQSLADRATHQRKYGPWNCSVPNFDDLVQVKSDISIEQIFHHFFTFYSTFNASIYELSPWTGRLQPKTSTTVPLSLFDPFEHDHNLTSNVSSSNWFKFQEECNLANQILTEAAKKRQHKSWGLSLILTRKSLPPTNFHHQPHRSTTQQTFQWASSQTNENELKEKVQHVLKDILLFEPIDPESIRKKRPASVASSPRSDVNPNALAEQFDETLSTKRRRIDEENYALTPIMDDESSNADDQKDQIFFQILYRTWQDRRRIKRSIDHENNGMPIFDREQLISSKLKEEKEHQLKTPLFVAMQTKLVTSSDQTAKQAQMRLTLQTSGQHQLFIDLGHFLTLYMPKMMENQ